MEGDSFFRPSTSEQSQDRPPSFEETQNLKTAQESARATSQTTSSSSRLHRSSSVLWIVVFYIVLAVVSWAVICVLSERPLTTSRYGYSNRASSSPASYVANEKWYQAMRVIQSIVGVLTIPITSAVCSSAAVAFAQYNQRSLGLTMRQTMVLADKGWTDPKTFLKLLTSFSGLKRYGSLFLFLAIALNLLGGLVQPLQQVFITQTTVKTPIYTSRVYRILDIPDMFRGTSDVDDDGTVVLMTRDALSSTSATDTQSQLWQSAAFTCDGKELRDRLFGDDHSATPAACGYGATLGNISGLVEPFFAQLPSAFSTGLIRQFTPRFDSTATYYTIDAADYPVNCSQRENGYYVTYINNASDTGHPWSVEVCMPDDLSSTPWKNTRMRQDFLETLFINISRADAGQTLEPGGSLYRIVLHTTAGYFQLPNYMNDEAPGELLEQDPNLFCDDMCEAQGQEVSGDLFEPSITDSDNPGFHRQKRREDNATIALEQLVNKGPLLTVAMALFGEGSYIAERKSFPDKFIDQGNNGALPNGTCVDIAPLQYLMEIHYGYLDWTTGRQCIANNDTKSLDDLNGGISLWLRNFQVKDKATMENAFTAAAFLATKAWTGYQIPVPARTLFVNLDMGADTQVPAISRAGKYLISILLAIFLLALFAMALYSTRETRWTAQLDAFAMMRLGAAMADHVPLMVGRRVDKVGALDWMPGWVGDVEGEAEVGALGVGAPSPLKTRRRYRCYDGDDEPIHEDITIGRDAFLDVRMQELRENGLR